jgi:Asp-tRNA(Asn)/Glu-tRNA(Gln) amidotransferase A subunit family amidase
VSLGSAELHIIATTLELVRCGKGICFARIEPHSRWRAANRARFRARVTWQRYFETHDVFLMPAGFSAAYPHDHSGTSLDNTRTIPTPEGRRPYLEFINWQVPASLTGLPSTVAPVGRRRTVSPSAFRSWDRSSRTARRFASPSC